MATSRFADQLAVSLVGEPLDAPFGHLICDLYEDNTLRVLRAMAHGAGWADRHHHHAVIDGHPDH